MATRAIEQKDVKLIIRENPLGRKAVYCDGREISAITSKQISEISGDLRVAPPLYRSNLAADIHAGDLRKGVRLQFRARLALKVWDDRRTALRLYLRRPLAGVRESMRQEEGKRLLRRRVCILAWRSDKGTFGPTPGEGKEPPDGEAPDLDDGWVRDLRRVRLGSVLALKIVVTKQGWPYLLGAHLEWGGTLSSTETPQRSDPLPFKPACPSRTLVPGGTDEEQKPPGECHGVSPETSSDEEPSRGAPFPEGSSLGEEVPGEEVPGGEPSYGGELSSGEESSGAKPSSGKELPARDKAKHKTGEPGLDEGEDEGTESKSHKSSSQKRSSTSQGKKIYQRALPTGFSLPEGTKIRKGDTLLAGGRSLGRVEWNAGEGRFFAAEKPLREWLEEQREEITIVESSLVEGSPPPAAEEKTGRTEAHWQCLIWW